MIRMMLSELMVGTCFVLDRVFSFLRFIVYFLIPSFSLGLQTLVAVGVGSVCDTWNLEQVSHHHCLQCQCQWGLNVSPGDLKQLGGGRQVGYAAAQRRVPLEAWFEYMVFVELLLLSHWLPLPLLLADWCWFHWLGPEDGQIYLPVHWAHGIQWHEGVGQPHDTNPQIMGFTTSTASVPWFNGHTHVNMFWDTNDNMLQSSSSSFSNQVHAFNALCTASSKGWASVP